MKSGHQVLLTGGTGFIGSRLISGLVAHGDGVSIVTRSPGSHRTAGSGVEYVGWLPDVSRYSVVAHFAGEPLVAKRWSDQRKREIRDSRVATARRLVDGIAASATRPSVLISASAIGIYGDRGDEVLVEGSSIGSGFLSEVCAEWEREALRARELGVRVVILRLGIVLGPSGGVLKELVPIFKLGIGGRVGSGEQWMSWVHWRDVVGLVLFAIDRPDVDGVLNATAPAPVTNQAFVDALGRVLHRPAAIPVPKFALRIKLGEGADVATTSQRVQPARALAAGYRFQFDELERALRDVLDG